MTSTLQRMAAVAMGVVVCGIAADVHAQPDGASPAGRPSPSGTTRDNPGSAAEPPTHDARRMAPAARRSAREARDGSGRARSDAEPWQVQVRVENGVSGKPLAREGVTLKAAPATGPFQQKTPEPVETWEAVTDEKGVATFEKLPRKFLKRNLEIYAQKSYSDILFESARTSPRDRAQLTLSLYPRTSTPDSIVVDRLRTIFQPWEDFLVVAQFWRLEVKGNRAVDTAMLDGERYDKGLPLELPLEAQGIHLFGPGSSKVVDSTVNWKGVLRPGDKVRLRVRFSIPAKSPTHVYSQRVDYPVESVEAVLPLQTDHEKVGRLDGATLAAKGFESVEATRNVPGLRPDNGYLYASGKKLDRGESFAVRLTGLPYERPLAPWVALGLGLVGFGLIVVFSRREAERFTSDRTADDAAETLRREREKLLDDLAELERAFENDEISEVTYETESLRLRERITLVMDKLDEVESSD